MKAQELRLGNLVYFRNSETGLYTNDLPIESNIMFDYDEGAYYIDDINISTIKPIPLTEEWLLKFGKNDRLTDCFSVKLNGFDKLFIVINPEQKNTKDTLNRSVYYYDGIASVLIAKLKFVHSFQNLYFALTQKELCLS